MNALITIALATHAAFAPLKVHVDGSGFMRFIRDGRVVYAKAVTLVNVGGELGAHGAAFLPEIDLPTDCKSVSVDLQGDVKAGSELLGRIVVAEFPPGAASSTTDEFFAFAERPTLVNPGDGDAGVIRSESDSGGSPKPIEHPSTPIKDPVPIPVEHKTPDVIAHNEHSAPTILASSHSAASQSSTAAKDAAATQVEIIVRPHSEVVGDEFTIGDIADFNGPQVSIDQMKQIKIGATTVAGFSRLIDARYVSLKLRGAGFAEGSYVLVVPKGADVARKTKTISAQDITDLAIKTAQEKAGVKLAFRVAGDVQPIVADDGEIVLEASTPSQTSHGYLVIITAREGNRIVGTQTVTLTPPADAIGVKVGDTVKVVMKAGTAVIEVEGRALSAGFVGQTIKVSITASPTGSSAQTTTHTATVIDAGSVEVDL